MGKKKHVRGTGIRLEFPKAVVEQAKTTNAILQASDKYRPNRPNVNGGNQQLLQQLKENQTSRPESLVSTEPDSEVILDKLIGRANDETTLKAALTEWTTLYESRKALRAANVDPDYHEFEQLIEEKKLDSTLKKCSGFVKRLRCFTTSQRAGVEKEFQSLNLTKFLSEICRAVTTEARLKTTDVGDVVFICSNLHQRYREFSSILMEAYRRVLFKKEDFTAGYLSKLGVDLRIVGEMIITGLFDVNEGYGLICSCVKTLISMDKEGTHLLMPMLSFIRGTAIELCGTLPRNIRTLSSQLSIQWPTLNVMPLDKAAQVISLLREYYDAVVSTMHRLNDGVLESEGRNRRFLRNKGEVPKDREDEHAEILSNFQRFKSVVRRMSKFLDFEFPELRTLAPEPEPEQCKIVLAAERGDGNTGLTPGLILFDCEETRSFYQDLPDMKVYLPQMAYRDNLIQTAKETAAIAEREKEAAAVDVELEVAELGNEMPIDDPGNEADADDIPLSMQPVEDDKTEEKVRPTFAVFLIQLTNCVNQKMIDASAIEFVDKFNTKPNRKKLIRTLFHIPRQRVDLLPLWSRFVAILGPVMPEIYLELSQMLFKDFRHLVKKKDQIFIETKLKITRFIGELVNFGLFPKADAFQCFRMLLLDFVHHQVEMACAFIETCGRVLHRSPDSHRRMHIYLEEMMRKTKVKNLEPRYLSMIEHAYYSVCPPESTRKTFEVPLMAAYIKQCLQYVTKDNLEQTIIVLRGLNWSDKETWRYALQAFTEPQILTYSQIRLCASMLSALTAFQREFTHNVCDVVMESVKHGMECNDVRYNQDRISTIVYISELYTYRLFGSTQIFSILYALITYGVHMDYSKKSPLDPPDCLFRIRLACQLLKITGEYFTCGLSRQRLNYFLFYLQRYYWYKRTHRLFEKRQFPYAITEVFYEVFRLLRPKFVMAQDLKEACRAVDRLERDLKRMYKGDISVAERAYVLDLKEREARGEIMLDRPPSPKADPFVQPIEEEKDGDEDEVFTPEQEAEFSRMFDQMCVPAITARPSKTHIPIPLNVAEENPDSRDTPIYSETGERLVTFSLLTKARGKTNVKSLLIPESSDYVQKIRSRAEEEREERARMKQLTLGMSLMQEAEERQAELIQKRKELAGGRMLPNKKTPNYD